MMLYKKKSLGVGLMYNGKQQIQTSFYVKKSFFLFRK